MDFLNNKRLTATHCEMYVQRIRREYSYNHNEILLLHVLNYVNNGTLDRFPRAEVHPSLLKGWTGLI